MSPFLTDSDIRALFGNAGDFVVRQLSCQGFTLYAYAIDGLTSGGDTSEYVFKPLAEHLAGDTIQLLYDNALRGGGNRLRGQNRGEAGAICAGGGKHRQGG